ncbi:MAG TPA: class I SAM-dependent methyltransferase [Thermoleophilaceae bacterium]|jgi:SAM-dependent methyltransferase|nr:class I SAM-dependent methyltransferase [Thermoleophilaceae bacterium]
MPDLTEIRATWNSPSGWVAEGDEWSGPWGGTVPLWWGTLMPRIRSFVPTGTILEIGPGHGRWSQFLKDLCETIVLVDVAENCIDACRARFSEAPNIRYHIGDGRSLDMLDDNSVDFAFSFDSLVHAEADALEAYARELARVLRPDGVAFLHHSNMGAYARAARTARRVPDRIRRRLTRHGLLVNVYAWRAETTTAEWFAATARSVGLACVGQEKLAWEYGRALTDVISVVTPQGSSRERPNVIVENRHLMDEARAVARAARVYEAPPATERSSST